MSAALDFVSNAVSDVVDTVSNVVDTVVTTASDIVSNAIAHPVETILTIAAVATGQPELIPVINAGSVVANGGSLTDAAIAGGTAYISQGVGNYVGGSVATDFGSTAGSAAGGAAAGAANAAMNGGNPLSAAITGGVGGAVMGSYFNPADGSTTFTQDDGSTITTRADGSVTSTPSPYQPAPVTDLSSPVAPAAPVTTPVRDTGTVSPVTPVGPAAPANLISTGSSDSAPGTIYQGANGPEIVLNSGKTVNYADYQAAVASGQPVSIDGAQNAQFRVEVGGVPATADYNPKNLSAPEGFRLATAAESDSGAAGGSAITLPNGEMMWVVPAESAGGGGAGSASTADNVTTLTSPDGTVTTNYSDGTNIVQHLDGTSIVTHSDGTVTHIAPNGTITNGGAGGGGGTGAAIGGGGGGATAPLKPLEPQTTVGQPVTNVDVTPPLQPLVPQTTIGQPVANVDVTPPAAPEINTPAPVFPVFPVAPPKPAIEPDTYAGYGIGKMPALNTGNYLNPGLMKPVPYYHTTSPEQSQFYWGAPEIQYNTGFDQARFLNNPSAPVAPWSGAQPTAQLTPAQMADFVNSPQYQSYFATGPIAPTVAK